jgi:hypothetical protein
MILLTIEESDKQIISGIPEYLTVTASEPCVIFYTLDGTEPDTDSEVYVDRLYLTYSRPTVELKLIAFGSNNSSDIISMEWGATIPDYTKLMLTGREGINILPEDEEVIDSLAYDSEGNEARETTIPFQDLDMKANTSDRIGQEIPGDSTLPFVNFPIVLRKNSQEVSSTSDANFNPSAKLVIIDGYTGFYDQEIRVINRPHGTMSPTSKFYTDHYHYNSQPSGDFVNYFYNPKTKKIVLYYREYLDNRWIISSQKVDAASINLTPTGNRFVFRWLIDRAQTKIF